MEKYMDMLKAFEEEFIDTQSAIFRSVLMGAWKAGWDACEKYREEDIDGLEA